MVHDLVRVCLIYEYPSTYWITMQAFLFKVKISYIFSFRVGWHESIVIIFVVHSKTRSKLGQSERRISNRLSTPFMHRVYMLNPSVSLNLEPKVSRLLQEIWYPAQRLSCCLKHCLCTSKYRIWIRYGIEPELLPSLLNTPLLSRHS